MFMFLLFRFTKVSTGNWYINIHASRLNLFLNLHFNTLK